MKLISNDEVDKLKLNNGEFNKEKKLRKKERNCIQKRNLINQ